MGALDPKSERRFLEQFRRSVKSSGEYTTDSIAHFHQDLEESMERASLPWVMRLALAFYRSRLRAYKRRVAEMPAPSPDALDTQNERIESLRFAAHYGLPGNAEERTWCLQQIDRYGIAPPDARFLVWIRTVNIRRRRIVFGHWDWILGIVMMFLILLQFGYAILFALVPNAPPLLKAVLTTGYWAMGCGAFSFYKSSTFDVFRIGLRYFRPNGWRYTLS